MRDQSERLGSKPRATVELRNWHGGASPYESMMALPTEVPVKVFAYG